MPRALKIIRSVSAVAIMTIGADQLLYMEGGEVVESGPAKQILNSPQDPRTKDFLNQAK